MDSKLVLSVVFVTLCWGFMGTYAQNMTAGNMTAGNMTAGNMTTGNMTSGNMTTGNMMGGNMTTGSMTTGNMMGGNMTTGSMTTANMMGGNMTTGSMTTANMMGGNMTTGNMTTGSMTTANMMAGNMTAGSNNVTTAAPSTAGTTTAPPVSTNTTVVLLETPVSRADCGRGQLCAAQPANCNPSEAGSCFFLGARQQSGQNFDFALSGESDGYMAASLASTTPTAQDPTYVCANNNGVVRFFATVLQGGQLVEANLSVGNVRGRVNGNQIQCTFTATVPISRLRTTSFSLSVSTGTFNAATGALGTPTAVIRTPVVNLADPNTTVTNELNTTSAPTTTAHAVIHQQSLIPALLFTLAVLLFTTQGGN